MLAIANISETIYHAFGILTMNGGLLLMKTTLCTVHGTRMYKGFCVVRFSLAVFTPCCKTSPGALSNGSDFGVFNVAFPTEKKTFPG
jgi:hypothetical protein